MKEPAGAEPIMADDTSHGRWDQLDKCPECGREMQRDTAVGERLGLFYICAGHGRFRYSWDLDCLEPCRDGPPV